LPGSFAPESTPAQAAAAVIVKPRFDVQETDSSLSPQRKLLRKITPTCRQNKKRVRKNFLTQDYAEILANGKARRPDFKKLGHPRQRCQKARSVKHNTTTDH